MNEQQLQKVKVENGFIAALDQSGGSTPKALKLYGVPQDAYSGDDEMFAFVHEMRSRIITSPSFSGDRILGAILFEDTMDRQIDGQDSADYLWTVKKVVPFLKVDKGVAGEVDGVQVMKAIPDLDALLARATDKGVFGTKMRSVIKVANDAGVKSVVDQQFDIGREILSAGLVPIIEPEIDTFTTQPWYTAKRLPSFADALAQLRRVLWRERISTASQPDQLQPEIATVLVEALAMAA